MVGAVRRVTGVECITLHISNESSTVVCMYIMYMWFNHFVGLMNALELRSIYFN